MSIGPRIPLVEPGTRPELSSIEQSIVAERGRVSLLYRALLNSAPLAEGWEKLLTAIRNRSSLPPDLRELAILRVAVLNRAPFEFDAHLPLARNAGVTEEKLAALPAIHRAKNKFLERVNYYGQDASLDGQGRVLIPQILRDAAKLPPDVVVTGNIDHLVVSDRGALASKLAGEDFTPEDYDEMSKLLMS